MKLIPKWAKGISFLQKERDQRLTEKEGKPSGDVLRNSGWGIPGGLDLGWNTS